MTDAEIIKALNTALGMEHISIYCVNIENEVQTIKVLDIIDLINRKETEIEKLKKDSKRLKKVQMQLDDLCKMHHIIKAEAYKEFAERLKKRYTKIDIMRTEKIVWITETALYNLTKEMEGELNGTQPEASD